MKAHLDVVGVIDLITGILFAALGVLVLIGVLLFAPMFYGSPPWNPADEAAVLVAVLLVSAVFFVIGIPSLIAGSGLLKSKGWARTLAMILAVLALTGFPVGTVVGLYTLWVLTHEETKQLLGTAS